MAKAKKGTEYVCEVCGATLVVTESGIGIMEEIVCCEKPMAEHKAKPKKKAKTKKTAATKRKKTKKKARK